MFYNNNNNNISFYKSILLTDKKDGVGRVKCQQKGLKHVLPKYKLNLYQSAQQKKG
jgi:hypothetical protein